MRDGVARQHVAELQADIGFLRQDVRDLQRAVSQLEDAMLLLGLRHRERIPPQWVRADPEKNP